MGIRRKTDATDSDGKKLPKHPRPEEVKAESTRPSRARSKGPVRLIDKVDPIPVPLSEASPPSEPQRSPSHQASPPQESASHAPPSDESEEETNWDFLKTEGEDAEEPEDMTKPWSFLVNEDEEAKKAEASEPEAKDEPVPEDEPADVTQKWSFLTSEAKEQDAEKPAEAKGEPANKKPEPSPQSQPKPKPIPPAEPAPQSKPQPAPQSKPQPAPQSKPQPAPQSKPQPAPQSKPQPAPQSKPQPAPQSKPQPAPQSKPQPTPQSKPQPAQQPPARSPYEKQAPPITSKEPGPSKPITPPQSKPQAEIPAAEPKTPSKSPQPEPKREKKPKREEKPAKAKEKPRKDAGNKPQKQKPEPSVQIAKDSPHPKQKPKPRRQVSPLMAFVLGVRDLVLLILALVPAAAMGILVYQLAVDIPYGKDWESVDSLMAVHDGSYQLEDLHAAKDGQRIMVPPALHLFMTRLTDGNAIVAIWMNFAVIALTSFGIFLLLTRTLGGGAKLGITFLLANLIIFSPVHGSYFFTATGLGPLLALCGLVWACFFAARSTPWWLRLPFCLVCGLVASYSSAYGLVVWPAVFFLTAMLRGIEKPKWRIAFLIPWTLAGVAVIGDYFMEFQSYTEFDASRFSLLAPDNWEAALGDWFAMVSQTVFGAAGHFIAEQRDLMIVGVAVISLLLVLAIRWMLAPRTPAGRWNDWNRVLPWMILGGCGLGGSAIIYLITSNQGANWNPSADDYILVAPILLSLLVTYVIISTSKSERKPDNFFSKRAPLIWAVAFFVIFIHQGLGWSWGIPHMASDQSRRFQAKAQLLLLSQI